VNDPDEIEYLLLSNDEDLIAGDAGKYFKSHCEDFHTAIMALDDDTDYGTFIDSYVYVDTWLNPVSWMYGFTDWWHLFADSFYYSGNLCQSLDEFYCSGLMRSMTIYSRTSLM